MFGHDQHHHDNNLPEPEGTVVADNQSTAPAVNDDSAGDYIDDAAQTVQPAAAASTDDGGLAPASDDTAAATAAPAPAADDATVAPATPVPAAGAAVPDTDQLLDIKQQALQQLTPLVGHLEQSPEEKFRTTMMMIQAADNHELIATAYEAAQQIPDEKVRAQALLDIVNEINYFTHNSNNDTAAAA